MSTSDGFADTSYRGTLVRRSDVLLGGFMA